MKRIFGIAILFLSLSSARGQTLSALNAYTGTWIIYKDSTKTDTLCKTVCHWSADGKQLLASQTISGPNGLSYNNCVYSYDTVKKTYSYYETDLSGKVIATADITISGHTWIYYHHISRTNTLWRTINLFNDAANEIVTQTQKSDDGGTSWTTTRSSKEYKAQSL